MLISPLIFLTCFVVFLIINKTYNNQNKNVNLHGQYTSCRVKHLWYKALFGFEAQDVLNESIAYDGIRYNPQLLPKH